MSDTNVHRVVGNLLVGSSHFFVDTVNNRVGVNTSSPSASLDIATGDLKVGSGITLGNSGTITATAFDGDGSLLQNINSDSGSWVKDNVNSKIYVSNTDHRVAIGTTSASELLTVGNDGVNADVVNNIRLNGRKANADGEICGLYFANSKDTGDGTTGSSASIRASRIGGSNFATQLDFYTNDGVAVGSGTSRLTILGSGNVGLGTSSPQSILHVKDVSDSTGTGDAFITSLSSNPNHRKPTECLRLQGQWRSPGSGALLRFTNLHTSGTNPNSNEYNLAGIAGFDYSNQWGGGLCLYTSPNTSGGGNLTARVIIDSSGNVGVGSLPPSSTLHVRCPSVTGGRVNIERFDDTNSIFTGLSGANTDGGRGQLVLSSAYSDLVIASSRVNHAHGSTLSFVTYNPSNSADYRKFVINQGNWGTRKEYLDFGCSSGTADANPHLSINSTDTVLTLDGTNKRVGIGVTGPSHTLDVNGNINIGSGNKITIDSDDAVCPRIKLVNGGSYSLTNGAWTKLCDFGHNYLDGAYAIKIEWNYGNTGHYWAGMATGMVPAKSYTNVLYHHAPIEYLELNHFYHHRSVDRFEFALDSDSYFDANYGRISLYVYSHSTATHLFYVDVRKIL
jgi:hypothetical protein